MAWERVRNEGWEFPSGPERRDIAASVTVKDHALDSLARLLLVQHLRSLSLFFSAFAYPIRFPLNVNSGYMGFIFNCRARGYWFVYIFVPFSGREVRNFSRRFPKIRRVCTIIGGKFSRFVRYSATFINPLFNRSKQISPSVPSAKFNRKKICFNLTFNVSQLRFRFPKSWSLGRFPCPSVGNKVLFVCRWIC